MKRTLISKHVEVEGFDSFLFGATGEIITEPLGVQVDHLINGPLNRKDVMLSAPFCKVVLVVGFSPAASQGCFWSTSE